MAGFDMSGIDDIVEDLMGLADGVDDIAEDMLLAGAEEVKKAQINAAGKHGLRDTGAMIKGIGYKKPKTAGDVRQIDIFPQGKDAKGIRNVEKAYIHHYGTSSIQATHWMDEAEKEAAEPVQRAMEAAYDKGLKEKGMR